MKNTLRIYEAYVGNPPIQNNIDTQKSELGSDTILNQKQQRVIDIQNMNNVDALRKELSNEIRFKFEDR